MDQWDNFVASLTTGGSLSYDASYALMDEVMAGELGDVRLASLLSVLAVRGVTGDELHGLADAMRDNARSIALPQRSVDIVGTGGDRANTVNISTMAAIVVASMGIPVVKHGNRASTSASGSADVLEALGVNLQLSVDQIIKVFADSGIAFLFANNFHPSMRFAAATRRELGFPTVFNVLGPLTNPARPRSAAIGVARADVAPLVANVFARRGDSAVVFRGANVGLDEITTTEPAQVWVVKRGRVDYTEMDPVRRFGMPSATLEDLRGGDPDQNARVAREVLGGAPGAVSDAVALNAAAGIVAARGDERDEPYEDSFADALSEVQQALSRGLPLQTLNRWVDASQSL